MGKLTREHPDWSDIEEEERDIPEESEERREHLQGAESWQTNTSESRHGSISIEHQR